MLRAVVDAVRRAGFARVFGAFAVANAILVGVLGWQAIESHERRHAVSGIALASGVPLGAGAPTDHGVAIALCNESDARVELESVTLVDPVHGARVVAALAGAVELFGSRLDARGEGFGFADLEALEGFELPPGCPGFEGERPSRTAIVLAGVRSARAGDRLAAAIRVGFRTDRGTGRVVVTGPFEDRYVLQLAPTGDA
jgi:hypothetical protein